MIHLFINALAASAGGGLTYVRNVVPILSRRNDVRATVLTTPSLREELRIWHNVQLLSGEQTGNVARRVWYEQRRVPTLIRQSGPDVLLSVSNFALWNSPVPQILLSRNALYTSSDFKRDLRHRRDYALWMDTVLKAGLAKASVRRADITVAPSYSFAEELRNWTGVDVATIHHGFDRDAFCSDTAALSAAIEKQIEKTEGAIRLLFVSHYNYYRNFETLLRAIPLLRDWLAPRPVRLFLTCKLEDAANPGTYRTSYAAALVQALGISKNVIELGSVPYSRLHHLYSKCNLYVTPAYAESFAHPLVEAMSMRVPIVAADIPVHREICRDAALYFDRFNPRAAADAILRIMKTDGMASRLGTAGLERSRDFSWQKHFDQILGLAASLMESRRN